MSGLEREQEWTNRSDLLQPLGQIAGHNDQGVLQLAIGLGGNLWNE